METGTEFYPLESLKIGLTLFRLDMADEIMWVNTSPFTGENQNVASSRHNGEKFSFLFVGKTCSAV